MIASLTGCGTNQNIAQILSLLNEMNEQLTNMEAQMTEILTMLAQQAQTDAYNASGLPQLEGVYDAWLMDLLELSDPAVEVQPLSVLPPTARSCRSVGRPTCPPPRSPTLRGVLLHPDAVRGVPGRRGATPGTSSARPRPGPGHP